VIMSAEPGVGPVIQSPGVYRRCGATQGGSIDLARTAVPVEWDEVKQGADPTAVQLGPTSGSMQGPLGARSTRPRTPSTARASRSTTRCGSLASRWAAGGFAQRYLRYSQEPAGAGQRAVGK